jgi:hypothetical protein
MPARPTIGSIIATVARSIQSNSAQLAAGAVKSWMMAHRVELLTVIQQAQTERGAELLRELCRQVPIAAGAINFAMSGSPGMAILAIRAYDPELAQQLDQHRGNLEKLQEYWRLGASTNEGTTR